jgi:hypothetical protein
VLVMADADGSQGSSRSATSCGPLPSMAQRRWTSRRARS